MDRLTQRPRRKVPRRLVAGAPERAGGPPERGRRSPDRTSHPTVAELAEVPGFLRPRFAEEHFPWPQVAAYAGSLLLTFAALALALGPPLLVARPPLAPSAALAAILALALAQAGLQLGVFMHLRESRGPAWQLIAVALALFTGVALVGFSIWILAFRSGLS